MSTLTDPFPDAELLAMDLLAGLGETVTATPEVIAANLIQVERAGGADDGITDRPQMLVTAFGPDRQTAWALIRAIQARVVGSVGQMVTGENLTSGGYPNGVLIDAARTISGPSQVPESGRGSRMIEYTFRLDYRRPWW